MDSYRVGKVCLFLSHTAFDLHPGGLAPLMETWGGEGIYMRHVFSDNPTHTRLQTLGTPSVVVVHVDLSAADRARVCPGLAHSFVGAALGLSDIGSTIHFYGSIPAEDIQRIIQPGDRDYPAHPRLPR